MPFKKNLLRAAECIQMRKKWLFRTSRAIGIILQHRLMENLLLEQIGIDGLSLVLPHSTGSAEEPQVSILSKGERVF